MTALVFYAIRARPWRMSNRTASGLQQPRGVTNHIHSGVFSRWRLLWRCAVNVVRLFRVDLMAAPRPPSRGIDLFRARKPPAWAMLEWWQVQSAGANSGSPLWMRPTPYAFDLDEQLNRIDGVLPEISNPGPGGWRLRVI